MAQHRMAQPVPSTPSVLFLITAVFARSCWKYRGVPYQLMLMEVGALYQTMYLAATQLGLAACPIGAFPELATAELLGLDSRDEAQVGMLALGMADEEALATARIVALRELPQSAFSGGAVGAVVELTYADGMRAVLPAAELEVTSDGNGELICRMLSGRQVASVDGACQETLRRLLRP
jgi:hypothetical protein